MNTLYFEKLFFKGANTLRIFTTSLLLSFLSLLTPPSNAQEALFTQASCTIVYSLKGAVNQSFNDEIGQLKSHITKQNIQFIDLNNWNKSLPHIELSGRLRNQLRKQYDLKSNVNQAIVLNKQGQVLSRYSRSLTLVSALFDCP